MTHGGQLFLQQSGYTPQYRTLSVIIAGIALAVVIVLLVVFLIRALADVIDLVLLVDVFH